ncbi:hypothetical protein POVCU2_0034750 [Plasmodium ovale curtisi]|uniref:Uncharacterized protein n=1 Tax=Plasmodium ovale curtisi TaxID=864141 RepID=A0A1A8W4D5_PLAOA|nr:hypothetical protein POVCU2_0034750 [Plasmodium ovale curtisi]SBS96298.1 hypothetical protein POVCU1_031930 [Plasmodium ovale curtisi]
MDVVDKGDMKNKYKLEKTIITLLLFERYYKIGKKSIDDDLFTKDRCIPQKILPYCQKYLRGYYIVYNMAMSLQR